MSTLGGETVERAMLGAVLVDPERLPEVADRLSEDDLCGRHSAIYSAMLAVNDAGRPLDVLTLRMELDRNGTLERAGGVAYLSALENDLPSLDGLPTYVAEVAAAARRRRALAAIPELKRAIERQEPFGH